MKMLIAIMPTVLLVVIGQLVTKWRVQLLGSVPDGNGDRLSRAAVYLTDPYIIAAYVAALLGSVAWMFVVERYAISVVFPLYIGLTVLLVVLGGVVIFGEHMSITRVLAIVLILAGVALGARS